MAAAKRARAKLASRKTSTPSQLLPGVFVGGWKDAVDFAGARFCVLDEEPDDMPAGVHLAIYDGENDRPNRANLDRLAELAEKARAKGEPVLFYCGHGVRRGPLAGAWYLHVHERIPLEEAYARLREVRPGIESVGEWVGHWEEELADAPPRPAARSPR